MQLFDSVIGKMTHHDDVFCKWVFHNRFNWFLSEISEWLSLIWAESQVFEDPEFFKLCQGERERRLSVVYLNRRNDYLSPQRWERYYAKHKPKLREISDEEGEKISKEDEQMEKEREELDNKFLREKIPDLQAKMPLV